MAGITILSALFAGLCFLVYFYVLKPEIQAVKKEKKQYYPIIILLVIGLGVRIVASFLYKGYQPDLNCFSGWADRVYQVGFSNFYAPGNPEIFTDYPPGYMYVLYVIGFIKHILPMSESALWLLIKAPALICDVITAYLIYTFAAKRFQMNVSVLIAALYLFNIAVFTDSALWGQVDSVFTLCLVLMLLCVLKKRLIPAYFLFGLAVLIKPQAFMFTPILIYAVIEQVFLQNFSWSKFCKNLFSGLGAIAAVVLLALPFGLDKVLLQYVDTLGSYAYASVNSFNLWGALNMNWEPLTPWMSIAGNIFIVLIVVYTAIIFFRSKDDSKYCFVAAFLSFATFILSVKMHERYAFPCMAMLLLTFIMMPKTQTFSLYALCSTLQFVNMAYVLFLYAENTGKYYRTGTMVIASLCNVVLLGYMVWCAYTLYIKRGNKTKVVPPLQRAFYKSDSEQKIERTQTKIPVTRIDIAVIAVLMAVYSAVALYNLGDTKAPHSEYVFQENTVVLDLGSTKQVSQAQFFLGTYELNDRRNLTITVADQPEDVSGSSFLINKGSVFAWNEQSLDGSSGRYVMLSADGQIAIEEFVLLDENREQIIPVSAGGADALFDEQALIPQRISYRNSSYFDEIYHARTGYEFVHGLPVYEWTHPPLGKVIIAAGIQLFGMTPFGWRIAGTVFGIFMIPVIYLFAKRIMKQPWLAAVTCILLTFDFMHFAQTRIATIDVYATFFIMLMYYYMYKYYTTSFYDTKFSKTLIPLGLSGLFMGLGIASKWTGAYAGIGLAVLFFITLFKRYREYRYALLHPEKETNGIYHADIIRNFKAYTLKTICCCLIFFIVIPAAIYLISYIPYMHGEGTGIAGMLKNQNQMFTYHAKTVLDATHPYSSRWYEWPVMLRPIWYYSGTVSGSIKEGISSFGNPAVWWVGIGAFIYMVYLTIAKRDKTALFLVIAYLAQLVSWIPVTRITFIYHYFPCVPFITLMIGYSILTLYRRYPKTKKLAFVYAGLVILLFAMFYPVLSGMPVSTDYVQTFLKWLPDWVLI